MIVTVLFRDGRVKNYPGEKVWDALCLVKEEVEGFVIALNSGKEFVKKHRVGEFAREIELVKKQLL